MFKYIYLFIANAIRHFILTLIIYCYKITYTKRAISQAKKTQKKLTAKPTKEYLNV